MRAAGPGRAASPRPCTRFVARCRPRAAPASGSFPGLMPGAEARAPEAETPSVRWSPPLSCSDSTLSLLSPLGPHGFPCDADFSDPEDEEGEDHAAGDLEAKVAGLQGLQLAGSASYEIESDDNQEEQKQVHLPESDLTPWEVWFVGKEKEERGRLQLKVLEELNQQLEKRKKMEEREKRKMIAEEKHKEWVQKKNKQERKEREQKINKEMEEKAAKKLEKEQLQEKAKEKYQEWLKKKNAEECEKKKKEKEKEKQRQAELQEKKEIAGKKFKEWLQNAKNKPRPSVKSYGYANGKLTGRTSSNDPDTFGGAMGGLLDSTRPNSFYNGNSYPEPTFYNPIPWKPIHMPPPKEAKDLPRRKIRRPVISQPHTSSLAIHKDRSNLCLGTLCRIQR